MRSDGPKLNRVAGGARFCLLPATFIKIDPMKTLRMLLAAALLIAAGCTDSQPDLPVEIPVLTDPVCVDAAGGPATIRYTPDPLPDPSQLTATADAAWLHAFDCTTAGVVRFEADPLDAGSRQAKVTLRCPGAVERQVTVRQAAEEATGDFVLTVENATTCRATIRCRPADPSSSYVCMVTDRASFERYSSDEEYIRSDVEYIRTQAELQEVSFEEMLSRYLSTGESSFEAKRLEADTDYYAYAFGLTPEGDVTTGLTKAAFRTEAVQSVDCTFTIEASEVDFSSFRARITPSDPACTYFVYGMPATDYEAFGSDEEAVAAHIDLIVRAVEIFVMGGYDYTASYFLSQGTVEEPYTDLTPDTDYVIFAFGLDEACVATTPLMKRTIRTAPFVATDDCTFRLDCPDPGQESLTIRVEPSDAATRYYVGICCGELLDSHTADELAAALIAEENDNGIDWAASPYVFTGPRTLDSAADLAYKPFTADTEYGIVVFGIDPAGRRTTAVATHRQRTAAREHTSLRIGIEVEEITNSGARLLFTPSNDAEAYFTDCIDRETFDAYPDEQAFTRHILAQAGGSISSFLTAGRHTVDCAPLLRSRTDYVAYAFGYDGGVTTGVFSRGFTTAELPTGGAARVELAYTLFDGDACQAADPVRYAGCGGKAVVRIDLKPDAEAAHWYVGSFRSLEGYTDEVMIEALLAQGLCDERTTMLRAEWNAAVHVAAVAVDAQGKAGPLARLSFTADRSAATPYPAARTLRAVPASLSALSPACGCAVVGALRSAGPATPVPGDDFATPDRHSSLATDASAGPATPLPSDFLATPTRHDGLATGTSARPTRDASTLRSIVATRLKPFRDITFSSLPVVGKAAETNALRPPFRPILRHENRIPPR